MGQEIDDRCQICLQPEGQHHSVNHTFTPPGRVVDTSQFARKRPKLQDRHVDPVAGAGLTTGQPVASYQMPFDPVLRQALIDANVITVEQLDQAKKKIEAITNHVMGGGHDVVS